ncbi:hypothetical protein SDC9_136982 [bioreactor metagenome]|uniref:Peptidase M56 domain-containing protein n=1 Tax=bioreactor metagenome TaxID=1076179 RepID=A0A645DKR3_9ZZZZ
MMFAELFYWVLNMSIIGSLTGLILLILRQIKPLPKFSIYVLWLLPLFRLWIPVGLSSPFSLLSLISHFTTKAVVLWDSVPAMPDFTSLNCVMAADHYFPLTYKTVHLERFFEVSSLIWLIGTSVAILTTTVLYFLTKSELKSAEHLRENLYQSDKICTPAVYGIVKPKIILPKQLARENTDYICLHEKVHIHRRDNLWRMIAIITACVHWYNPLVWLFLKCFFIDMELACDAKVAKQLDDDARKVYAHAGLSVSSGKTYFASAFGGSKIKVRIENILSYKKLTVFSGAFCALFIALLVVFLATNAVV